MKEGICAIILCCLVGAFECTCIDELEERESAVDFVLV